MGHLRSPCRMNIFPKITFKFILLAWTGVGLVQNGTVLAFMTAEAS